MWPIQRVNADTPWWVPSLSRHPAFFASSHSAIPSEFYQRTPARPILVHMFPYRGHLHYPLIHSLRYLISSHYHFFILILSTYPQGLSSSSSINNDGDGRVSHNNRLGTPLRTCYGHIAPDLMPFTPSTADCRDLPLDSSESATAPTPFGICAHTLSMARIVTPSGHPQCGRLSDYPPMRGRRQQRTVFSGPRRTYHISDQLFFLAWTSQGSARARSFSLRLLSYVSKRGHTSPTRRPQ